MTTTSVRERHAGRAPLLTAAAAAAPPARPGVLHGRWGRSLGLVVATCVLGGVAVASVLIGNYSIGLADAMAGITGTPGTDVERIVRHIRIPRTITGLLAGVALGIAGAVMQGVTRNPLAGPGILGVNAGAGLAVLLAMTVFSATTVSGYVWFAFVGAAIVAVLVHALASLGFGGATPVKLALAGAAFTALLSAVTSMITLADATTMEDFRFWVVGSLTRADGASLAVVAPFIAVGVAAACSISRTLNALALGEDMARSLGTRLWLARAVGALSVVLLSGAATAIAGPLGFIGLVAPHIARMITGSDYRWVLAWTAVLSPVLLLLADILGRILVRPQVLQVGIITALAGAPFFLYLVRNRKVAGL